MPTPEFVLRLREKIGNDELWLSGVTAVVLRGEGPDREVLLVKRSDNGEWTAVTGIVDPGEPPAVAAEREVLEEADIVAVAERLARVHVDERVVVYGNGDRSRYIDLTFRCRYVSGEPFPADGENTEAAWFRLGALPPMRDDHRERIEVAASDEVAARFQR
ncbi:NUDIX hydrolase [Gryllotalpicola protaetiae]|uniref:NUDIX domain-containing protein n=1 Tax=Gryllotalpicola protaetiae TaxID=2419771 RepID=A0A387BP21_9MICO|nr:NUDIX domain-containing protein [Gryllotalpicola protaetiae]AYG04222.1 NUDIX domain-containing protein [Gryllotalpicola protaetiae]